MNASSSMTNPAFPGRPITRMKLIAATARRGIFDMERKQNYQNLTIAAFKFDDRVELMFEETVPQYIKADLGVKNSN